MAKRNPQAALLAAKAKLARTEEDWEGKFADRLNAAEGRADRLQDELEYLQACKYDLSRKLQRKETLAQALQLEREVAQVVLADVRLQRAALLGIALTEFIILLGVCFHG
jgi:hypothetical protein